jgi:CHAT domain-containing protein
MLEEARNLQDEASLRAMVLKLDQDCPEEKVLQGFAFHTLAAVLRQMHPEEAVFFGQQALQIRQEVLSPDDLDIGKTHFNLGLFFSDQMNFWEAEKHFEQASAIFSRHSFSYGVLLARKESASVLEARGDLEKAAHYIRLNVVEAEAENFQTLQAGALLDWSNILLEFQQPGKAIEKLEEAVGLYHQLQAGEDYELVDLASCFVNFAYAYDDQENYHLALQYYEKALDLYRQMDAPEQEAACSANIGYTLMNLQRWDEAEAILKKGVELSRSHSLPLEEARCLDNLGDIYRHQGQLEKAISHFQQAIVRIVPGFSSQHPHDLPDSEQLRSAPDKQDLLTYLLDKGKCLKICFLEKGDPDYLNQAIATFRAADQLVDWLRLEHTTHGSRLFWREATRPVYQEALETCFLAKEPEAAFYFMERSRAILLLEAVSINQVRAAMPKGVSKQELFLKRKLHRRRIELAYGGEDVAKSLLDSVVADQHQLDQFLSDLKQDFPDYAAARYELKILDASALERFCREKQLTAVSYFLGTDDLYVFGMDRNGSRLFLQQPLEKLGPVLDSFLASLEKGRMDFDPEAYAQEAFLLQQFLLEELKQGLSVGEELLIVPDGKLAFVPFDALMERPEFSRNNFLIQHHLIRYAYSFTVLLHRKKEVSHRYKMVTFAPGFENRERDLSPLFASKNLVKQPVLQAGVHYSGPSATRAIFQQEAPQFAAINLLTHAHAGREGVPGIEFADGTLSLPELYGMHIPADLVLLGACETNIGALETGEGVMSLARGFTFAGAGSLIASLWKVPEGSTAKILSQFYEQVQQGESKAQALRQAKIQFLKEARRSETSPYYWGAFVYVGENNVLSIRPERFDPGMLIAGISILGFVLVALRLWKNNNRRSVIYSK